MNVFRITSAIIVLIIFLVTGCTEQKPEPVAEPVAKEDVWPPVIDVKTIPERREYEEEVFGDSEIFSVPRLQFAWQAPKEKEKTIWTTTLEGDDLRRVVAPDLFLQNDGIILHLPVRSPDNRYLVVSMGEMRVDGTVKYLFDLKEKNVKEINRGDTIPHFAWTPDSIHLYYYNNYKLNRYSVETGKNETLPIIYSQGLFFLSDGKLVTTHNDGFSVYSKELKKISKTKIEGGCLSSLNQAISPDGSLLYFEVACNKKPFDIIFKRTNPDKILYKKFERTILFPAFDPCNNRMYFSEGIVEYLDLKTKETRYVFRMPKKSISHLTILKPNLIE